MLLCSAEGFDHVWLGDLLLSFTLWLAREPGRRGVAHVGSGSRPSHPPERGEMRQPNPGEASVGLNSMGLQASCIHAQEAFRPRRSGRFCPYFLITSCCIPVVSEVTQAGHTFFASGHNNMHQVLKRPLLCFSPRKARPAASTRHAAELSHARSVVLVCVCVLHHW